MPDYQQQLNINQINKLLENNQTTLTGYFTGTGIKLDSTYKGKNFLSANEIVVGSGCHVPTKCVCFKNGDKWLIVGEAKNQLIRKDNIVDRRKKTTIINNAPKPYSFWMLVGQYILQWNVIKNVAELEVVTKSFDFPPPHNKFHNSNFGLSRINKNEFYMPQFGSLSKYNISSNIATDVIGEIDTFAIRNPHACYSLPNGEHLISIEMRDVNETARVYYLKLDGSIEFVEPVNNYKAEIWSVAAINSEVMYVIINDIYFCKFNRLTNELTYIFSRPHITNVSSIYGSSIEGLQNLVINYAFMDIATNDCYVVGLVEDSGIPGLQKNYPLTNITKIGDVPDSSLKIITANFPPGVVTPGDRIDGYGVITQVINDNTVYCSDGSNETSFLETNSRHFRTVIWKVTPDLNVSIYYKFPTIDNRQSADGYRQFFNNYSRGGLIDPKTKDIYLYGERNHVIKDGVYSFSDGGFDNGNLVKITKNKQLIPLKNKFERNVSVQDKSAIVNNWYTDQAQLETIY